uniref:BTB domain-containing protein n=1 Tax=Plectus sambesii TaxID=2011161 RepID=A0A914W4P9_9BILA
MEFDSGEMDASRRASGDECMGSDGQSVYVTASSTRMETVRFLHRWAIDQFSVQQELSQIGEFLESSPFGSANGQYKFRLKLFPCGKDEDCRGYLSLFLQIQKCPTAKLRFRVNFYIETTEGPRGCALNRNVVTINKGGIVTASKFFSMETLKGRTSRFLPDDTLTVGVELTVFGEQNSREIQPDEIGEACSLSGANGQPLIPDHSLSPRDLPVGSIGRDMGSLLDSKEHADITLVIGRRTFRCHKAILSARSPVFAAMWGHQENQEVQTGEANLEDVTSEAVSAMLEFIYTDRCSEIATRAGEILAAADKYCLDRLKSMCEQALIKELTPSNLCDRLRLADAYGAKKLRRRALLVFQRNKTLVLDSREWMDLEQECPQLAAGVLKELMTMPDDLRFRLSGQTLVEPPTKRPRLQ